MFPRYKQLSPPRDNSITFYSSEHNVESTANTINKIKPQISFSYLKTILKFPKFVENTCQGTIYIMVFQNFYEFKEKKCYCYSTTKMSEITFKNLNQLDYEFIKIYI